MRIRSTTLILAVAAISLTLSAQSFAPLRAKCEITTSTDAGKLSLRVIDRDCPSDQH